MQGLIAIWTSAMSSWTQVQHGFDVVWLSNIEIRNGMVMHVHTRTHVIEQISPHKKVAVAVLS